MGSDASVPEWIKGEKAERERQQAAAEAQSQRNLAASMTIQAGVPKFWKDFLKELENNTGNLKSLGLHGSLSPWDYLPAEEGCRVQVERRSRVPQITYTDIHFKPGESEFRCDTCEGKSFRLSLCLDYQQNVAVIPDGGETPLDPKGAAQFIVERMAKMVAA
jgi:hypothetical protein